MIEENNDQQKVEGMLNKALDLLDRAAERLGDGTAPDENWWPDLFALTGDHMILTEEGWEPGSSKQSYLDEWAKNPKDSNPILQEVNAPGPDVEFVLTSLGRALAFKK